MSEDKLNCQLVRVQTRDNVHLHGLFVETNREKHIELDAAICVHGLGGNFYASRLNLKIGEALSNLGLTVVQINTRGHDDINQTSRNGAAVNLGAAFEIVDECRWDIHAWIDSLVQQGFNRIALVGHSLGAIKSIYSQALQPHQAVKAIVAVSASRLCYEKFLELETRDKFLRCFDKAQKLIDEGNGNELMRVDFPFPTYITATAYRDKYGPEDRYNWLKYAPQLEVPTLLVFGERELNENSAFIDIVDDINRLELPARGFDRITISGANHFYAARQAELANEIEIWLANRFAIHP